MVRVRVKSQLNKELSQLNKELIPHSVRKQVCMRVVFVVVVVVVV
jgi:hypothetical protein